MHVDGSLERLLERPSALAAASRNGGGLLGRTPSCKFESSNAGRRCVVFVDDVSFASTSSVRKRLRSMVYRPLMLFMRAPCGGAREEVPCTEEMSVRGGVALPCFTRAQCS